VRLRLNPLPVMGLPAVKIHLAVRRSWFGTNT